MLWLVKTMVGINYIATAWKYREPFIIVTMKDDNKEIYIQTATILTIHQITEEESKRIATGGKLVTVEPNVKGIKLQ